MKQIFFSLIIILLFASHTTFADTTTDTSGAGGNKPGSLAEEYYLTTGSNEASKRPSSIIDAETKEVKYLGPDGGYYAPGTTLTDPTGKSVTIGKDGIIVESGPGQESTVKRLGVDESGNITSTQVSPSSNSAQPPITTTNLSIFESIAPASTFSGQPLSNLLNQIFYIGLGIAVILAIVMIVRGGIQYMTIDAASSKDSGKKMVQAALGGLVLAFAAILILNTINPKLTELNLSFSPLKSVIGLPQSLVSGTRIDPTTGQVVPEGVVYVDGEGNVVIGEGEAHIDTDGSPGTYKVTEVAAGTPGSIVINGKSYISSGATPLANAKSRSGSWVGVKTDASGNPIINSDGTLVPVLSWGNGTVNGDKTPFVALSSAQLAAAKAADPSFKLGSNVLLTANGKTIQAVYADNAGTRDGNYSEFSPAAAAALGLNYRIEAGKTNYVEGSVKITLPKK